ncbi:Major Facilitator Superfamily protein [Candida parapsilosis]|uniref:MFS domain-containing protein n=2 Tax=Candida parapsilosis TaxID=5480 RepID=G8BDT4_CANPC|nr:uncharacterized protein CPAR2_210750 [Candida parapsilosis]KAF6054420.1 Major Facilitator Superfamily protein [Candida parapsilosis]KAF6056556.1 Major Facilitator Superfamily protein [Candida parapsilosis]KAF6059491.1 Major Facilitator Superfamily protein [Candida parapsilosis]KAF6068244.1 Major Facilitator Superfamily protein [Candida parapsilosis]KAI5904988.1 transporter MCH4 [Candida parapsilosis]
MTSISSLSITVPQQVIHSSSHHSPNESRFIDVHDIELQDVGQAYADANKASGSQYDSYHQQTHQLGTSMRRRRFSNATNITNNSVALMYGSEANPNEFPEGGRDAYLVLVGSFIGLVADFGIPNALGAIESYVSANQLKDVSKADVGWVFSLHLGVMYLGGVVFGELFDMYGAKKPLIAGTILMCAGLFCTAECTKLYQFVLSFSVLTAIGTSVAMSPLIGALSHWYLKRRAMACSIATIGGLVGGSCFAIMLQQLYDKVGYKNAIRVLSCICFFCMSCAILLVRERKVRTSENSMGNVASNGSARGSTDMESEEEEEIAVVHEEGIDQHAWSKITGFFKGALDFSVLKDMKFVSLTWGVFLAEVVSMTTLTYLGSYALEYGVSDTSSYLLLTIINVCGIPSRLLSGIFADIYGRFNMMMISSTFTTIFIFGLWYPAKSASLLYAFGVMFGISSSAVISLIPACTGQICSSERFGKVYGTLYFFLGVLTILGMYFATLVIAGGSKSNYSNFVLFEGALSTASILVWIWAKYSAVGWKWCKF